MKACCVKSVIQHIWQGYLKTSKSNQQTCSMADQMVCMDTSLRGLKNYGHKYCLYQGEISKTVCVHACIKWQLGIGTPEGLCMVECSIRNLVGASACLGENLWLIVESWVDESSDLTISFTTQFLTLFHVLLGLEQSKIEVMTSICFIDSMH